MSSRASVQPGMTPPLTLKVRQSVLRDAIATVMGKRRWPPSRPALALVTAPPAEPEPRSKILVVDDEESGRHLVRRVLEEAGFGCDLAASGEEALRAVADAPYDLVLIDSEMPEMDGWETARRIREREQGSRQTAIVVMTESPGPPQKGGVAAGMDEAIGKPLRASELLGVLERYLSSERPLAE